MPHGFRVNIVEFKILVIVAVLLEGMVFTIQEHDQFVNCLRMKTVVRFPYLDTKCVPDDG